MLTGIEWTEDPIDAPEDRDHARSYDEAFSLLAWRRYHDHELPQWLTEVIDGLRPDRRELVWAWLNGEVDFVASSED